MCRFLTPSQPKGIKAGQHDSQKTAFGKNKDIGLQLIQLDGDKYLNAYYIQYVLKDDRIGNDNICGQWLCEAQPKILSCLSNPNVSALSLKDSSRCNLTTATEASLSPSVGTQEPNLPSLDLSIYTSMTRKEI